MVIVATILFGLGGLCGKAHADPLIFMPFRYGEEWRCVQPQHGTYSHQGNLAWGIDFNMGPGLDNEDNPAFGKNLYSPVNGTIVEVRDGLRDFVNTDGFNAANHYGWGNTIVILDEGGDYYVRLAHLRLGSTDHLYEGKSVKMYEYIGQVGQTGFSSGPHLHIQVMEKTHEPEPWEEYITDVSSPFTFVEGDMDYDDRVKSGLTRNISVIDNNNEQSLSNQFEFAYRWFHPRLWQGRNHEPGTTGTGYYRHRVTSSNDNTTFNWRFRVKESGYYAVMATFPVNSNQDPDAEYQLDGQPINNRDQTRARSFYKFLFFGYLGKSIMHTVSVRGTTPGTYVVADAIVVRKIY